MALRSRSVFPIILTIAVLPVGARAIEPTVKWEPWLELGGYAGTDDLNRGETNVFLPLLQESDWLLFIDGKGKLFEDEVYEGGPPRLRSASSNGEPA